LDTFLILSSVLLFIVSSIGIILAAFFRPSTYLIYAQTFAGGAFLGVAILHFIPRAVTCFSEISADEFPVYSLIIVSVFLFFVLAELLARGRKSEEMRFELSEDLQYFSMLMMHHTGALPSVALEAIIYVFLLVHCVIIGFALYFQHQQHPAFKVSLLVNAVIERLVEAFAVTLLLKRQVMPHAMFWIAMVVYVAGTPVTILALAATNLKDNKMLDAVSMSLSAGVFFFIGVLLWRKTFLTPFDWRKSELVILSTIFIISLGAQALTCITPHV
jgi:zinc transporter ZupT